MTFRALAAAVLAALVAWPVHAAAPTPLGQPTLSGTTLASRCPDAKARFNFANDGGFDMYGPAGIAIDPRGRVFMTDFGGRRVLTWPNVTLLTSCKPAEAVIGAGALSGPEAVAVDTRTGDVFVADTLSHTVVGYRRGAGGAWNPFVTLGTPGVQGTDFNQFNFPRGLAFDPGGRLFVADDFNNRVLIFDAPFTSGEAAVDSLYAGADGGFSSPKAVAMVGHTLFVADYDKSRVLRFTGPFDTPDQTYKASGTFTGVGSPVDLAVGPEGSLLVTDQAAQRVAVYSDAAFRTSRTAPTSTIDFDGAIGPEPLGVAADINGRVFVADYRRYRVLFGAALSVRTQVTASPTPAAKALLKDLRARPARKTDRVLIGQQLISYEYGPKSDPKAWYGDWLQMKTAGLPLPEVMAAELSDLMSYPGFAPNQDALDELIAHGKAGHPVSLVWHPDNPTGGAFGKPISTADMLKMTDDTTAVGKAWQVQLNRAAAVLKIFADNGVPVMLRPLHEQNGNFFWWGHTGARGALLRSRQLAYVSVWRDMVTEFATRKNLKNLVFVFGANQIDSSGLNAVDWAGTAAPLTYYPGGRWADVVSIDLYDEQLDMARKERGLQHYAALVGTGKPVGIAEFGQDTFATGTGPGAAKWDARALTNRIKDSYPRIAFAIAWYSSPGSVYALPDVSHTAEMLANPLIDTQ